MRGRQPFSILDRLGALKTEARRSDGRVVRHAALLGRGLIVGLVLLGMSRLIIEAAIPAVGARIAVVAALPIWQRLINIYLAPVGEELVFKPLALSVLSGVIMQWHRPRRLRFDQRLVTGARHPAAQHRRLRG